MGALIRAHDWKKPRLSAEPDTWPAPLRTCLMLLLNGEQPMYIWWGAELLCFYNDAYRRTIGPERHPSSIGRPGREVWSEAWDDIGPQIDHVLAGRGSVSQENALVPITRNGRLEQVYWTYSYNPILDPTAQAGVGGVTRHVYGDPHRGSRLGATRGPWLTRRSARARRALGLLHEL